MFSVKTVNLLNDKLFETSNGLWKGKKPPYTEAGVIRNTNFTSSGRIDLSDVAYLAVEEKQLKTRRLQPGDIILERSGGGPKQPVGRVVYFEENNGIWSFSNFTSKVRVKDLNKLNTKFVFYFLLEFYDSGATDALQRRTTGIRNLDWKSYKETVCVPLLPLPEQRRIAAVLSLVQRAVEQQEKLIKLTTELKKALMHELFTEGTRGESQKQTEIGPVPESWDVVELETVCAIKSSAMSYKQLENASNASDGIRVVGVKVSDMNLPGNELEFIMANLERSLSYTEANKRTVPEKSIVFPKRGAAIATNKKRLTTCWTVLDPNLIAVKSGDAINYKYLFHWFNTFDLKKITDPGPTPQLNKKDIAPLKLPMPSLEEQVEIANAVDCASDKVTNYSKNRNALSSLFSTLLHQLMTSEIRVDDLDLEKLGLYSED